MKSVNSLLGGLGTTIFTVMSALAVQHGSINLGQGFPDTDGPDDILRAAADALFDGRNQYPPMTGVPELRQAVALSPKDPKLHYDLGRAYRAAGQMDRAKTEMDLSAKLYGAKDTAGPQ